MRDLVLLLGCLAMLPAAIRHAHLGVMLWAWSGFLAPSDRVWGFMTAVPLNKVFAAATVLAMLFDRSTRRPCLDLTMVLMLLLLPLGLASASTSISNSPEVWIMFEKTVKVVALCVVVTMVMHTRLRLHSLLLAVGLGLGLSGVWEGMAFLASGGGHRVQGLSTLGDNNQFALAMLMLLPLLLHLYRQSAGVARWGLLAGIVLTTVSVVAAFSRGGFIGLVVLAVGVSGASRKRYAQMAMVGVLAVAVWALAPPAWLDRIGTIGSAGQDASFNERLGAWKISMMVALDNPLLGGGFHAVQDPPVWASYVPASETFDFLFTGAVGPQSHAPHSIYFEVLSDLGFPGLVLFLSLMASGLWNGQVVKRACRGRPGLSWASDMAALLQVSIMVYAVSGAALSMAYFELFYLELAVLSVLRRLALADHHQDLAGQRAKVERPHREVVGQ
jgi:probable O-glycosylation ligase (exosortase A-associated)